MAESGSLIPIPLGMEDIWEARAGLTEAKIVIAAPGG